MTTGGACARGNLLPRARVPLGVWGIPPVTLLKSSEKSAGANANALRAGAHFLLLSSV